MVSRFARRLAAGLVVLAFLAAVAAPAQAGPHDPSAPAVSAVQLVEWIHGLIARLGLAPAAPAPAPDEPEDVRAIFGREGACFDPNGNTIPCPEETSVDSPPTVDIQSGGSS